MKKLFNFTLFTIFIFSASGLFTCLSAQKSEEAIRQMLEERNQEIKALLGPKGTDYTPQQRQKLKDIINEVIDYRAMARFALENTWQSLSEEERDEFVEIFSNIVREHSLTNLDIYRAKVNYESIEIDGDSAKVVTLATLDRVRPPVTYNLFFEDDLTKWVVVDLIVDNVSTADSYRRQFQDIIRDKGYDYLLDTLKERVNK